MQYPRLFSITNRTGGTVNVTPLTSLLAARTLGETPDFVDSSPSDLPRPSDADLAAARQQVLSYLLERPHPVDPTLPPMRVDASGVADFVATPFSPTPGDPHDDAIERLAQTFINGETIKGVEEHMLARNEAPATLLEIMSLELDADCVRFGSPNTYPVGRVHITLAPAGEITIGTYSSTLAAGDRLRRRSAFPEDSWAFELVATSEFFSVEATARRLSKISLSKGGGSGTDCRPTAPLRLGARIPSILAQIRLLDMSFPSPTPTVNCPAGPSFPGISDGLNAVVIDSNGALRVSGYLLHLPSLAVDINADIIKDGVLGARVDRATFHRDFVGGFDHFSVDLNTNGVIESASFGQQRSSGAIQQRTCG